MIGQAILISFLGALLVAQIAALVARVGAAGSGGLRVRSLLVVVIARVPLDHRKLAPLVVDVEGEGAVTDLDVVGQAAEVLLLVVLSDRKLVVYEVVALDGDRGEVVVVDLLELLELLVEDLVEDGHEAVLLRLQALLLDG